MDTEARRLIADAELRAERIVGAVRMAVAAILGTAFLVAVVGQAPEDDMVLARQFSLAVATIGGYLLLGLVAFAVSRPRLYRPWMSWIFATVDVGFVLASVVLGLNNAALPPNYAVAFPVVWLIPTVLAFGALRYNPYLEAYVATLLIGGLVLTAGFETVPGLAKPLPPPGLTVLFEGPPNVMRVVMIGLASLVLVIAVRRARGLLVRAIDETRRKATLTRFLPTRIADWVMTASAAEARIGCRQTVAVMFVDIRDFTGRAESLDPADLGVFIGEFRHRIAAAVAAHDGVVDKFIGDSVMALFGVPRPGKNDAGNALACGRAVLDALKAWNTERAAAGEDRVEAGVGLHWGDVFCGAIGDDDRLEFTVLGDTVNVAARIEKETKTAGLPLLVSRDLLDAAGASIEGWAALPDRPLRGRQRPVALFGLTGSTH
ncbi:MAG: adenylate/guanylate cyclase domain-containing protein [Inquilinus sp.]|nr:adenylate/guanylate cyclase domain-containing protein [Inquilinus sp.]